jgi:peptide/nickel transport system ATP-binding protein
MSLLEVSDLTKHFPLRGGLAAQRGAARSVRAADGVSFHIDKAETLALVGESGCGKSTVGRAILRLIDITAGKVVLDGKRIDNMRRGALRRLRRRMQVVFQDPFSSLNPRLRVRDILAEPIRNFRLAKSLPIRLSPTATRLVFGHAHGRSPAWRSSVPTIAPRVPATFS